MWKVIGLLLVISLLAPVAAGAQAERIHIDIGDWEYDSREGITRLLGDVYIRQGATEIWADNGLVRGTINQPEHLELEGSPCRWKGTLEDGTPVEGNSSRIEFDIAADVLRFTGNVRFEGPQGTYTADVLVYDMNTGQISGRGEGDEGRVSFVIEPEAIEEASQDDSSDDDD